MSLNRTAELMSVREVGCAQGDAARMLAKAGMQYHTVACALFCMQQQLHQCRFVVGTRLVAAKCKHKVGCSQSILAYPHTHTLSVSQPYTLIRICSSFPKRCNDLAHPATIEQAQDAAAHQGGGGVGYGRVCGDCSVPGTLSLPKWSAEELCLLNSCFYITLCLVKPM